MTENIKNICIKYNLHQYLPAVQKAFKLDTLEGYEIMILKLEGKVSNTQPTDLNLFIQNQGESNVWLILKELKDAYKQAVEENKNNG